MRNAVVAVVVLVAALLGYRWYAADQEAKLARALATNSASVLTVSFAKARSLKVYAATGVLIAKSSDTNVIGLGSTQTTKAPFTVDYFVDLSRVDRGAYRWDAKTRTMFVALPDLTIAEPNVDERRAQVEQDGLWISRDAGQRLQRAASVALANGATDAGRTPERIEAARRSAVEAVGELTEAPLAAAGLTGVRVVARFASDRTRDIRWDESRPISEVLADATR